MGSINKFAKESLELKVAIFKKALKIFEEEIEAAMWFEKMFRERAIEIQANVADYREYAGYYIIVGTVPTSEMASRVDLPGKLSTEEFLKACNGELDRMNVYV